MTFRALAAFIVLMLLVAAAEGHSRGHANALFRSLLMPPVDGLSRRQNP
jgi:hypothetical protein